MKNKVYQSKQILDTDEEGKEGKEDKIKFIAEKKRKNI